MTRGVLTEKSRALIEARYLHTFDDGRRENVSGLFKRASGGNPVYEALMTSFDFMPNSPTLFNAHTGKKGTLSACFVFHVADSMLDGPDSIVATRAKAAGVAKWGGGVGYYLGYLRPRGSPIQTVHRKACGPVAVLGDYQQLSTLITQGGKRELAQMAVLNCDHPDIGDFIHVKDEDPKKYRSFNISVSWTDQWMSEVKLGQPGRAMDTWNELVDSAWKTGDPGCYFFDTAERFNPTPHLGRLRSTNPCGEVPLLNNEPCNLGSINLSNFVTANRMIDWNRLYDVSCLATRFLDDILDWNHFPAQEIYDAAFLTRKLGLGVMAWADMLCLLHIPYASEEAVLLGERLMKTIDDAAYQTSIQLAKEKGPYPGYNADQATTPPIRNATRTCIAPTGTIYLICGADSSGIEPHIELEWDRKTGEGMILREKVNAIDESDGYLPQVANNISLEWHIKHQAAFQKYTNLAVSKTINMPESSTREDIARAYLMMWESGCKGGTIYRDKCRIDQVLARPGEHTAGKGYDTRNVLATTNGIVYNHNPAALAETLNSLPADDLLLVVGKLDQKAGSTLVKGILNAWKGNPILVELAKDRVRRKLPMDRQSITHKFQIVEFEGYLTVGLYDDGSPGEIFFKASKEGATISGLLDSWAKAVSLALQYGCPLPTLVRLNFGTIFEPRGMTTCKDIPTCTSIADYVFRYLANRFLKSSETVKLTGAAPASTAVTDGSNGKLVLQAVATVLKKNVTMSGVFCPDCNAECVYYGGCYQCSNKSCNYSRC